MNCTACSSANPDSAKFCSECGTPLGVACGHCGAALERHAKFCSQCGNPCQPTDGATVDAAPPPSRPLAPDPRSYTPGHLAQRILTSRSALEGERKQVSVLFCDVVGFTSMSERADPEQMHGLMDRYYQLVLAEVHRYEGTVNKFLGDGVLAWLMMVGLFVGTLTIPTAAVHAQCVLYAAQAADEDERDLLILDPTTGDATPVGDIGAETTGLAFHLFTGIMYGSTAETVTGSLDDAILITIDLATGAGTEVGPFNAGKTMADLAFDPTTGVLYGWRAQSTGDLHIINQNTGSAMFVGESGLVLSGGQGLAFGPGNQLFLAGEGTEGLLRTIDKATGLPISSVQLSGYAFEENINALAYDGQTLFGVTNDHSDLITIDPTTGNITTIGHAGIPEEDSVDAIEFRCVQASPAAHTFTLLAIAAGLLAIGVSRRRFSQPV